MTQVACFIDEAKGEIKNAIYSFFHPLNNFKSLFNQNYITVKDYDNLFYKKTISILSRAICYNQGEIIQYSYIAAEKHKEIKTAFNKGDRPVEEIRVLLENLIVFLNNKFFEITSTNFEYLHLYFSERGDVPPRICLKGNFRTEEKNTVVSVFRDSTVPYVSDCEIEKNTGFFQILTTGKYYLNNNIPRSAVKNHYSNPRLAGDKLLEYGSSNVKYLNKLFELANYSNDNIVRWKDCWIDSDRNNDIRSFYKSTLIIPMTFWNNHLQDEFQSKINIKNVKRVILGFLCFDHVETNYFNNDIDIEIGYIFADLLSIYLFNRLVYTEISETFNKVEKTIDDDFINHIIDNIDHSIINVNKKTMEYMDFVKSIESTNNNKLFNIDSILKLYGSNISSHKSKNNTEQSH